MRKSKILVIGAGPAGLSCAYELAKTGKYDVEMFEAGDHIGGMSRSFRLWGQTVDLGPHRFFSKDPRVNAFFREVVQGEYTLVKRLTRIRYRNRFFKYPLTISNVLSNLSFFTLLKILFDYAKIRLNPIKHPATFEDWVTNQFGKKLFETFFKSYSEKLWGIPCSQIDADWASQRIKSLSLKEAVLSAVLKNRSKQHKTLVDQFIYPKQGTGQLYEKCAALIVKNGGKIHLNSPVAKVKINDECAVNGLTLQNGEEVYGDAVISTMPITHLIKGFESVPPSVLKAVSKLYYRNTILVYLEIEDRDLFSDNWLYIHSTDVMHGRITNFRNWCPSLYEEKTTTILCMEFWAFEYEELWKMADSEIATIAKSEIRKLNLISENTNINRSHVVKVPKCYPVYETGYRQHLSVLENYLDHFDHLTAIGRYGSFKYNNQDHSILMGILAASNIINNRSINLWEVNTDSEYQEDRESIAVQLIEK